MKDESITQALLSEYSEIRAEIRTMITVSNTNFNTCIALIAAVVSLSSFLKDPRLLYLIPTTMFIGGMIILFQGASVNALGTYSLLLSKKIKRHLGKDKVVFDWEFGRIWKIGGHPSGLVFWGIYLVTIPPIIIFLVISWAAYKWWPQSLFIHALEFAIFLIYGALTLRYNTLLMRERMAKSLAEQTAGDDSSAGLAD